VLLAGSGLRIGEAFALRVDDVDFLRRTIRVERQKTQQGVVGPTKSRSSRRTVPFGQVVIDALAEHLALHPSDDGALWCNDFGEPVTYWMWRAVWDQAVRRLDLDASTHDLRHFYASALIAGGASVVQVQRALGHASATVTLNTYSHLWPGDEDRTRAVMDAALGPLADSLRTPGVAGG
jgi:integrase